MKLEIENLGSEHFGVYTGKLSALQYPKLKLKIVYFDAVTMYAISTGKDLFNFPG